MAVETSPTEYEDAPLDERPEAMQEGEADETQEEETQEHAIPVELRKILDSDNILEDLSETDVVAIRERVTDGYDMDMKSMTEYVNRYEEIIKLAAMKEELGDKTFPFVNASKVMAPALAKAAIEFNSRTVPELVNRKDIANVKVWGNSDVVKEAQAERLALAINWQLKRGIKQWAKRMDRALLLLPVVGMVFKKKWWADGEIKEALITADKMIYDHDSDSFQESPRKSHWFYVDQNDYESYVRSGYYAEIEAHVDESKGNQPKIEAPIKLIESHCTLDLDHDGYCEPYIVTFCECCDTVVKVQRRFCEDDIEIDDGQVVEIDGEEFFTQAGFMPSLDKPAVFIGWGDMLYDIFKTLNTMMRQMIDAGTLNNTAMNSGFISTELSAPGRNKSGRIELILGQLTKVQVGAGRSLKDMIYTPQFSGVSESMYKLFQDLKMDVEQYTSASQALDVSANEAASMYLARLYQSLKVPNAISSRVYGSLTDEFLRIQDLMQRYMTDDKYKRVVNWNPKIPQSAQMQYQQAVQQYQQAAQQAQQQGQMFNMPPPQPPQLLAQDMVSKKDFDHDFDLITTADPTMGSEQERISRAEIIVQRSAEAGGLYNQYEAEKNFLKVIGCVDIDKILPEPTGQPDPMQQAQLEWTKSDAALKQANAQKAAAETQIKAVDNHLDQRAADLMEAKHQAEVDNIEADTMMKLNGIDMAQASQSLQELNAVREHLVAESQGEKEAEAQATKASAGASSKPIEHPVHGTVMENDVQDTMAKHGMTRDQVMGKMDQHSALHKVISDHLSGLNNG